MNPAVDFAPNPGAVRVEGQGGDKDEKTCRSGIERLQGRPKQEIREQSKRPPPDGDGPEALDEAGRNLDFGKTGQTFGERLHPFEQVGAFGTGPEMILEPALFSDLESAFEISGKKLFHAITGHDSLLVDPEEAGPVEDGPG